MTPVRRGGSRLLAALVTFLAVAACNDSDASGSSPIVVTSMEPTLFVAYRPTALTVRGSGFLGNGSGSTNSITAGVVRPVLPGTLQEVVVTLRASAGTPFANGTSAIAQVPGTVVSDTEIQATSPVTSTSGGWQCIVEVSVASTSGASTAPLAVFAGLTLFDIDHEVIVTDQATPFEVFGFNFLPLNGTATVRFTSATAATFPGGSTTLDVQGTVASPLRITGVTPVLALAAAVPAFVTVILDQEPGAPQTTSSGAMVAFVPPGATPVVVTSITPPLPIGIATPFTITGSGFQGAGGSNVEVAFVATTGAPFFGGTASVVTVLGTATSDTTITGTSPVGTSTTDVSAFVAVTRSDGVARTSATAIATFTHPIETVNDFAPTVLPADGVAPFTIAGTGFPAAGTATVRFRALEGTPFTGGTVDTVDVTANIASTTQIVGPSPFATLASEVLAEVTVILPNTIQLPMGAVCVFVPAGPPPPSLVVTNLNDSGAGSLRDTILNAPAGGIVSFAPQLTGTIVPASTLVVPRSMRILGVANGAINVDALGGDFPVFTIEAAATATTVDLLQIFGSGHLGDGGAFFVQGGLKLNRCQLVANFIGGRGGGVFVGANATFAATECTLSGNISLAGSGGAVFASIGATAQVSASSFSECYAVMDGGAFYMDGFAALSVVNSTFYANTAVSGVGGVARVSDGAVLNLQHCTLAFNNAGGGAGGVSIVGILNATNCLFRNSAPAAPDILNAGTNNTTFSLLRDGDLSNLTNGVNGNQVGTSSAPIDPLLGVFQFNGGPTKTLALKPTSPALQAGGPTTLLKDQRGVPRALGAGPDMGAYEATVIL